MEIPSLSAASPTHQNLLDIFCLHPQIDCCLLFLFASPQPWSQPLPPISGPLPAGQLAAGVCAQEEKQFHRPWLDTVFHDW